MRACAWRISVLGAAGVLGLASCSELQPPDSKREAQARWAHVRARLKRELAEEHFAAGRLDEAQEHVKESIGVAPDDPAAYILLAKVLLERGETASAGRALEEVTRLEGDCAATDYLRGLIAQRRGHFSRALSWYEQAARREPTSVDYVVAKAEMLVALDRVSEALTLVVDRWTDFDNSAALRALAGQVYLMLGRYEEAADAYRQANRIAPDDRVLKLQLGFALSRSGSHEEARDVLQAATLDGKVVPTSLRVALGRCHLAVGEPEQAKVVLKQAVEADPKDAQAWQWLARAAIGSDDLLTARRAAAQAVLMDPARDDLAMLLGYVCWRQRDFAPAAASLQQTLAANPDEPVTLTLLARCHEEMGDRAMAREYYARLLRANPECDWVRRRMTEDSPAVPRGGGQVRPEEVGARSP